MPIITLTTDLGLKDHYVGAIKGAILSELPDITIIDISHQITPFRILEAAYVLKNAYRGFPQGSIHIIGVNAEASVNVPHIGVEANGHYFVGADNGIFSFMFDRLPDKIVELNIKQDTDLLTFPTRDVFTKAACHLARGGTLEVIGRLKESVNSIPQLHPAFDDKTIRGTVMYIDSYQNIICNITKDLFKKVGKGRDFTIEIRKVSINSINEKYGDVTNGEVLALFNSSGHLEIAQNSGAIAKLLNIQMTEMITINFE